MAELISRTRPRWPFLLLGLVGSVPVDAFGVRAYGTRLGTVTVETTEKRVRGILDSPNACRLEPGRRILHGVWHRDALIGDVVLCQTGPDCVEREFPFLAFANVDTGGLSASIKLDPGCTSPALEGGRLILTPTEKLKRNPRELQKRARRNEGFARRALAEGQRQLATGEFEKAVRWFERGVSFDDENWAGHLGLGVAEFKLGRLARAVEAYERARELNPEHPDIYYNLACALSRQKNREGAIANLRAAIERGFTLADQMQKDPDLVALFRDDAEFSALVQKARSTGKSRKL